MTTPLPVIEASPLRTKEIGPSSAPVERIRYDIQGLRAIAVSLVVVYHLWPQSVTGGYAGVDVFFVISGFLITSHLLEVEPRGPRDLANFWSRRIRRLLPAACLVLLTTLVLSRLFAPNTLWVATATQAKSAALYSVNWQLASNAVNYLAAADAPTPVQHFWSLSVEEQFYLVWPVLILVLLLLGRMWRKFAHPILLAGLLAATTASFVYSITETASDPARAYFVTPTRIWELGFGGLLAAAARWWFQRRGVTGFGLPLHARAGLAWAGIAAIAWTGFAFDSSTPFPSWQALLPVLGSAAVIAACAGPGGFSPTRILARRPVQWVGDSSYAIYLWHWPLIVLVPEMTGAGLGTVDKLAIIAASLVLAGLTLRFVENPFRRPRWARPLVKPYALGAALMACVVVASNLQTFEVHHLQTADRQALARVLASADPCLGARSLAATGCRVSQSAALYPAPLIAPEDKADAYADVSRSRNCFSYIPSFQLITCERGDLNSPIKVALVGNSHAGEWLPAIETIAAQRHWHITTYLASSCAFATTLQTFDTKAHSLACQRWGRNAAYSIVNGGYQLVIMANRISVTASGLNLANSLVAYQQGYSDELSLFESAGLAVVGIRDTPAPGTSIPDCLTSHTGNHAACDGSRQTWLPNDPLGAAIAELGDPRIVEADLTDYVCPTSTCPAVIGSVPVYFDGSHLTATYAKTLAPYLAPILLATIAA